MKLSIKYDEIQDFLIDKNFDILEIDFESLSKLLTLHLYHLDPFDRIIISQSIINRMILMSDDEQFMPFTVKIV